MNSILTYRLPTLLVILSFLVACNGNTLDEPDITLDAGPDQTINLPVERVWLAGQATIESPHRFKSTSWSQISGPVQLQLRNSEQLNTDIVNLTVAGEYQFRLTVSDYFNRSRSDDVSITVIENNSAPVVSITESSITAVQGTLVFMQAMAIDEDEDITQVQWEIVEAPLNSEFEFEASQQLGQKLLAPKTPGTYRFRLTVTDEHGSQGQDEIQLEVKSLQEVVGPQLTQITQQLYAEHRDSVANLAFSVSFTDHDYIWEGSAGFARMETQTPMTTQHPYRIASISKTMLAYLAMKMIEQGYFTLDTKLSSLLEDSHLPQGYSVTDFHVSENGKRGGEITIRQLLDQTTGIADHVSYATDPEALDTLSLASALSPEPIEIPELWTPTNILESILDRGLTQNIEFNPGEGFRYGNSNSDILGYVMEVVSGMAFHELLQQYVFTPLDMQHSFMELHDTLRSEQPVDHFYLIDQDTYGPDLPAFMYGDHNINQIGLNTSFAWAGGGIVSTLDDMQKFLAAIDELEIENNPDATHAWHNWEGFNNQDEYSHYALGKSHFTVLLSEETTLHFEGHDGAWGSSAYNIKPFNVGLVTWDSRADGTPGREFTLAFITLLDSLGYQASIN